MTRTQTLSVTLAVLATLAAACGGSTPPANDQTTVSVQKPADSSASAAAPAPAPAASAAAK
jgi:hypothetical protein